MTSATEELRRMLDERGADYRVSATGYSIDIGPYTTAYANRSDTTLDVSLRQVTPAQAVTATLGDADLAAENAKLRELVRFIMHQCNDGNPRCDECIGWNDGECVALLRMRELEVDA